MSAVTNTSLPPRYFLPQGCQSLCDYVCSRLQTLPFLLVFNASQNTTRPPAIGVEPLVSTVHCTLELCGSRVHPQYFKESLDLLPGYMFDTERAGFEEHRPRNRLKDDYITFVEIQSIEGFTQLIEATCGFPVSPQGRP